MKKELKEQKCVAPIPCTKNMPQKTVKDWLAKFDEEATEYKEAVLNAFGGLNTPIEGHEVHDGGRMAEEAADVSTVLASFHELVGINFAERNEAQRRVNQHNHERGRN